MISEIFRSARDTITQAIRAVDFHARDFAVRLDERFNPVIIRTTGLQYAIPFFEALGVDVRKVPEADLRVTFRRTEKSMTIRAAIAGNTVATFVARNGSKGKFALITPEAPGVDQIIELRPPEHTTLRAFRNYDCHVEDGKMKHKIALVLTAEEEAELGARVWKASKILPQAVRAGEFPRDYVMRADRKPFIPD